MKTNVSGLLLTDREFRRTVTAEASKPPRDKLCGARVGGRERLGKLRRDRSRSLASQGGATPG
jgi:hypothetical protein